MKKPRALTAEEIRHWRESNKHTEKLPDAVDVKWDEASDANPVSLSPRERLGEGGIRAEGSVNAAQEHKRKQSRDAAQAQPSPRPSPSGRGGVGGVATGKEILSPLKQLSLREAARSFRPYGPVEATLDLHGLSKLEAYERVQHFIIDANLRGRRHVAIITGKGRGGEVGVLRANLPHWLNEPGLRKLISAVAEARAEKGGAGVLHVLVKSHES